MVLSPPAIGRRHSLAAGAEGGVTGAADWRERAVLSAVSLKAAGLGGGAALRS